MSDVEQLPKGACPLGCPKCDAAALTGQAAGLTRWQGWRLAGIYALVFLWPLGLAVLGAVLMPRLWEHPLNQVVGTVGGLLLGAIGAAVVFHFILKWSREPRE
jgi:hypothetical protein